MRSNGVSVVRWVRGVAVWVGFVFFVGEGRWVGEGMALRESGGVLNPPPPSELVPISI